MSADKRPGVLAVWCLVYGNEDGSDTQIIGIEAESRDEAVMTFRKRGYNIPDENGIYRGFVVCNTELARQALMDFRPVTFADAKPVEETR